MEHLPEKLAPEVGGAITVNCPHGASELTVEMAQSPFADTGMPVHHSNGDDPIEY